MAEIAKFTKEELLEYEESLKIYRDNINVIETAKMEGREEGIKQRTTELVKNILSVGIDIEKIIQVSGLSKEEIEKIWITNN